MLNRIVPFGRRANEKPKREPHVGKIHEITDNQNITAEQHAHCVEWVNRVQKLYDLTASYCTERKLDPDLVYPGNEWTGIVPREGLKFRTAYNEINYLRLNAPFNGYHLAILDRLDERLFPDDWGHDFAWSIYRDGMPDDIVEQIKRRVPVRERLMPHLPRYFDHIQNVPRRYITGRPRMLGEIGIELDGLLVNDDVTLSQARINAMLGSGLLDKIDRDIERRGRARILEVGAGYGGLAYALKAIFGDRLEYVVLDLPGSLYFAVVYLGVIWDWRGCHLILPGDKVPSEFEFLFVANYMMDELAESIGPIDVAINCMSFPEMSVAQVRNYGEYFKRLLRHDGVVFDANNVCRPHHTDSKAIFADIFPYRRSAIPTLLLSDREKQDIWASRYIPELFDRQDAMFLRQPYT